jgi:hypothetical protein
MRVQKISEGSKNGRSAADAALDADARRSRIPLSGVGENDAAMVATGDWTPVYEVARPHG